MLIWDLQFGVGEISWRLKSRAPKSAVCGLKFGVGKTFWSLIFLVCHGPNHCLSINFFSKLDS